MKNQALKLLPLAIAVGLTLTLISTIHGKLVNRGDCAFNSLSSIGKVECASNDKGFPATFMQANPRMLVGANNSSQSPPVSIGVFSAPDLNTGYLIVDAAFWTLIALVLIMLLTTQTQTKQAKAKK